MSLLLRVRIKEKKIFFLLCVGLWGKREFLYILGDLGIVIAVIKLS